MKHVWLEIFGIGDTEHDAGGFTVDQSFFDRMFSAFNFLKNKYRYFPPCTAEHPEILGELVGDPTVAGVVYGLISSIRQTEAGGIEAGVRLNKLGQKLYDLGALTYVSPSFYHQWRDPHTSTILENVLREVSFVTVPHQKNLKMDLKRAYKLAEAVSLNEAGFSAVTNEDDMPTPEEQAAADALAAEEAAAAAALAEGDEPTHNAEIDMGALAETVATLTEQVAMLAELVAAAGMGGEEPPALAEGDEPAEIVAMNERLSVMENALNRANALAAIREDMPNAPAELAEDLVAVRLNDTARYGRLVASLRKAAPVALSATPAPAGRVGNGASPSVLNKVVSLAEQAASKGIARGTSMLDYMTANGMPEQDVYNALSDKTVATRINAAYKAHEKR